MPFIRTSSGYGFYSVNAVRSEGGDSARLLIHRVPEPSFIPVTQPPNIVVQSSDILGHDRKYVHQEAASDLI